MIVKRKTSASVLLQVSMTSNHMFPIDFDNTNQMCFMNKRMENSETWHLRYGHLNLRGLQLLSNKNMVNGLPSINPLEYVCESCALGKQAKNSFPVGKSKRVTSKLELIHMDLRGPMKTESLSGSRYFMVIIDDCSRCVGYFS